MTSHQIHTALHAVTWRDIFAAMGLTLFAASLLALVGMV
jgi:hypothetical protein